MGRPGRVKQNQAGVPAPGAPAPNGPAPSAPAAYAAATSIPIARPAPVPVEAGPSLSSLAARSPNAAGGEMTPAFTAAKVQIHSKLIEKFADHNHSSHKPRVRGKIAELADEYFPTTAMPLTNARQE